MKKILVSLLCLFLLTFDVKSEVINPAAVTNLLDRILGQRTTDNGQQTTDAEPSAIKFT